MFRKRIKNGQVNVGIVKTFILPSSFHVHYLGSGILKNNIIHVPITAAKNIPVTVFYNEPEAV